MATPGDFWATVTRPGPQNAETPEWQLRGLCHGDPRCRAWDAARANWSWAGPKRPKSSSSPWDCWIRIRFR